MFLPATRTVSLDEEGHLLIEATPDDLPTCFLLLESARHALINRFLPTQTPSSIVRPNLILQDGVKV